MSYVQEQLKKSREKLGRWVKAPEETPGEAALRTACDAYIQQACEAIRSSFRQEMAEGRVRYDRRKSPDSSSEESVNPHYLVDWRVHCHVNFKKRESYFEIDPQKPCLRFGFAIPFFYILEGIEQCLAAEGIYPVAQRERRVGLLRKHGGTETVKVPLNRPEICNGLDAASRDYSAGFTAPNIEFDTGSCFAYFIESIPNDKEGK